MVLHRASYRFKSYKFAYRRARKMVREGNLPVYVYQFSPNDFLVALEVRQNNRAFLLAWVDDKEQIHQVYGRTGGIGR